MRVSAEGAMTLAVMPFDWFSIAMIRAIATIPILAVP